MKKSFSHVVLTGCCFQIFLHVHAFKSRRFQSLIFFPHKGILDFGKRDFPFTDYKLLELLHSSGTWTIMCIKYQISIFFTHCIKSVQVVLKIGQCILKCYSSLSTICNFLHKFQQVFHISYIYVTIKWLTIVDMCLYLHIHNYIITSSHFISPQ